MYPPEVFLAVALLEAQRLPTIETNITPAT